MLFRSLDTSDTATLTAVDDIDPTTVQLQQTGSGDENGYSIVYKAVLVNGVGDPVTLQPGQQLTVDLVITDPNGGSTTQTLTIGGAEGADQYTFSQEDPDFYVEEETVLAILDPNTVDGQEGNLESVVVDSTPLQFPPPDVVDPTVVTLGEITRLEGTNGLELTASITNAPIDGPLVIQLSNAALGGDFATLTFAVGETEIGRAHV